MYTISIQLGHLQRFHSYIHYRLYVGDEVTRLVISLITTDQNTRLRK